MRQRPESGVKLDHKVRARLARKLLESLETLSDEENEQLWAKEADRRDADWDSTPGSARVAQYYDREEPGLGSSFLQEVDRCLRSKKLDGILTGVRQLRRTRPLETEEIAGLRVPTLPGMARIKGWLLVTRYTVRDYLDTVVLFERLGPEGVRASLAPFDQIYQQENGASPLAELAERLAAASPLDAARIELGRYRAIRPPWNDWGHVPQELHDLRACTRSPRMWRSRIRSQMSTASGRTPEAQHSVSTAWGIDTPLL